MNATDEQRGGGGSVGSRGSADMEDGGDVSHPIIVLLMLSLWTLHGKNRLQKAFVPLNIRRVAELLVGRM